MSTRHDLRRQDRFPCAHPVTITWRDARGDNKFATARAIDISKHGIRLQLPEPLPIQAYVTLRATKLGLLGDASVRHCVRATGYKYAVGAEFTAGLQWDSEKSNPL